MLETSGGANMDSIEQFSLIRGEQRLALSNWLGIGIKGFSVTVDDGVPGTY